MRKRTKTRRQLTLHGWRYKVSCKCGRSMRWYMDEANRDAWKRNHENGNWCEGLYGRGLLR